MQNTEENRRRVFISYSSEDSPFVQRLVNDLEARGVSTWIDDTGIVHGAEWQEKIESAIRITRVVVVVLSPHSVVSKWVKKELAFAYNHGRTIIPVKHKECELPLLLANQQFLDLESNYETGFEKLVQAIHAQQEETEDAGRLSLNPFETLKALRAGKSVTGNQWLILAIAIVLFLGLIVGGAMSVYPSKEEVRTDASVEASEDAQKKTAAKAVAIAAKPPVFSRKEVETEIARLTAQVRDRDANHTLKATAAIQLVNLVGNRAAVLSNAQLSGADLRDADFSYVNLSGADLRGADLRKATLRNAFLRNADLSQADLRDANLHSADLRGANLRDAKFKGIRSPLFGSALYDEKTVFPKDLDPKERRMTLAEWNVKRQLTGTGLGTSEQVAKHKGWAAAYKNILYKWGPCEPPGLIHGWKRKQSFVGVSCKKVGDIGALFSCDVTVSMRCKR